MRETATAAEVRANFIIEDIDEAVSGIIEIMRKKLDYEASVELLNEAINTIPQMDMDTCSMLDKLACIARQCFLMGFADSFRKNAEAATMSYNDIFNTRAS